jgi:IS4 transposase
VLRTTTSLLPVQLALMYRGRWRVEHAFRTLMAPAAEVVVLGSSPMAEKLYQRLGFVTVANFRLLADVPAAL